MIRGQLRYGHEHLTARELARLDAGLRAGNPDYEVTLASQCCQQLLSASQSRALPGERPPRN
jgi:hypothetical protein